MSDPTTPLSDPTTRRSDGGPPPSDPAAIPGHPRGPHAPTVLLGLVCLLVAALVIAYQVFGYSLRWNLAGPSLSIGTGVVLLVLGLIGLTRRER